MKRYTIAGVDVLGAPVKLGKNVAYFTDSTNYFKIEITGINTIRMTTPKGSYEVAKHPADNIYKGAINGRKFQISLKAIIGEIIIW